MEKQSSFSIKKIKINQEEKVWLICLINLIGFMAAIVFCYVQYFYFGKGYPHNTFLFLPSDHFNDFFNIMRPIQDGNPLSSSLSVYFPLTYTLLRPFKSWDPTVFFYCAYSFAFLYIVFFSWKTLSFIPKIQRTLASILMTGVCYPILFCLDRGNLDLFVFIFSILFVRHWIKSNMKLSAVYLSIAISMKLYPGILGVLYLTKRQFKAAFLTFFLVVIETLSSAAILPGGILGSLRLLTNNLRSFTNNYVYSWSGTEHNSTYYGTFKILAGYYSPKLLHNMNQIVLIFSVLALIITALMIAYLIFREHVLWKQLTFLTFSLILLPHVSFDYKLIFVLLPALLFMTSTELSRFDPIYAILFGLLLIPKPFWFSLNNEGSNATTLSSILNPVLMTALIFTILFDCTKKPEALTQTIHSSTF